MDFEKENLEKELAEMVQQKEETDKSLLHLEIVIGIVSFLFFMGFAMLASVLEMSDWLRFTILISDIIAIFVVSFAMLRIEQLAGYYECQKCHHRYVPSYSSICLAPHTGRTRYMKCPQCHEKSWHKKVISKQ